MKPLILQGHERSITQIKYNREGDLLISCAKDSDANVWYSVNGERLGTLSGSKGTIWTIDIDWNSTRILTGHADGKLKMWDVSNGTTLSDIPTFSNSAVRTCGFSYSANLAAYSNDDTMGMKCCLSVLDVRNADSTTNAEPVVKMQVTDQSAKITSLLWGNLDQYIITGHAKGDICTWDLRMGRELESISGHAKEPINDMQFSKDATMFITASKDHTAKLFTTHDRQLLKTYTTERPVNSAALSPILPHVVLGGGQEAREVTTTSTKVGKFDARFYHLIFEEEFARIKGHFGPINSLAFHPDGKSYASGGEDGFVRLHTFDQAYFDYTFDI
ncbi:hypothetical protein M8J76_014457 [Diaphorina citri]|nr:hypothetical protein M8J75_004238 [Diaphorina citri]KAI5730504.1 hypothetical protein M8J76_014457 [Diaphorina citri]KAI5735695.1 hypothetical protein M8J77_021413 [Diaphorina citri]